MSEKFNFRGVGWLLKKSPNIGDNTVGAVGFLWIDATCKKCETEFRATPGESSQRGRFDGGVGAIGLNCAGCEASEVVGTRELSEAFPYRDR